MIDREQNWNTILDPFPPEIRDGARRFMRALIADYPEMGEKVITEVVLRNLVTALDEPIWAFADESYDIGVEHGVQSERGEMDDEEPLTSAEEFWDE